MIRHKVIEGDSLWRLSHRYLGSGTRWPLIFDFHNAEAAHFGAHSRLMPIEDENLIYVGQTILVPVRAKQTPPGTGVKADGDKAAIPIKLKVEYTIGKDTPPMVYTMSTPDFTIKTELSGKITIEVLGPERYNHNLELALGKDPARIKSKLRQVYDPAICALTAEPEISYESGLIKINAPIAAEQDPGPYMIRVEASAPNHLSGYLRIQPFEGRVMAGGRKYKYNADIELKAEMVWHPMPKGTPEELVNTSVPKRETDIAVNPKRDTSPWRRAVRESGEIASKVFVLIVGIAAIWYLRGSYLANRTTSMSSFSHTVDPNNPRYLKFIDRNPGTI